MDDFEIVNGQLTKYHGTRSDVIIPQSVNCITDYAFSNHREITSIAFPDSLKSIGSHAFSRCYSIKKIDIPQSVEKIGTWAFEGCTGLEEITIPDVVELRKSVFSGDYHLQKITIWGDNVPQGIDSISYGKELHVSFPVTFLPTLILKYKALSGYANDINTGVEYPIEVVTVNNLFIVENLLSIMKYIIEVNDTMLLQYILSSELGLSNDDYNSINECIGCSGNLALQAFLFKIYPKIENEMAEVKHCPPDLTIREANKLWSYKILEDGSAQIRKIKIGMRSIVIPHSIGKHLVKSIKLDLPMEYAKSIDQITFPDTLETILDYSFNNCSGVTELKLPVCLKEISPFAFRKMSALKRLNVDPNNSTLASQNNCVFERKTKKLILGCATSIIPDFIRIIGQNVFRECVAIKSLFLPPSVVEIERFAFFNTGIEHIDLPEGVSSIPEGSFCGCKDLAHFIVPNNITSIGRWAFSSCDKLGDIQIHKGVTEIGEGAFRSCDSLVSIQFPEQIKEIGNEMFKWCKNLKHFDICDSVTSIGEGAFESCSSLEQIRIPSSCSIIHQDTFYGCSSIEKVVIPNSVKLLEYRAFADCTKLVSLDLGEGLEEIENSAFKGCKSLTEVQLPSSIQRLGRFIFYECNEALEIKLPDNILNVWTITYKNKNGTGIIDIRDVINDRFGREDFLEHSDILKRIKDASNE